MQSDMNVLRSSAFIPFDFVLHAAILLSDSFFLLDKHVLMNFLRSSPFLSAASLLHAVIRSSCPLALKARAAAAPTTPNPSQARTRLTGCRRTYKQDNKSPSWAEHSVDHANA